MIVGIDEVGRGAWAGPLVVGAVLLGGARIDGLTDSKKLTKRQRQLLTIEIRQKAAAIGLGWVSARHIDKIGLSAALKLAARRAVMHIRAPYSEIIIDGTIRLIDDPCVTLMKKADLLIPSVSAASIVAKVARDAYMTHAETVFKGYGFKGHVGYGTAVHRQAIDRQGITPLHRLSFAPLARFADTPAKIFEPVTSRPQVQLPTTKQIGLVAEQLVAEELVRQGHTIIVQNWRTKFCEIDIVSRKATTVYFTEVKYRKNAAYGDGLAAITFKKQRQMRFAAEYFAATHQINGSELRLVGAAVAGSPPVLRSLIELT